MKYLFALWINCILLVSLHAQSLEFSAQILNKGAFNSNVSILQDYDNDGDLDIIVSRNDPRGIYWLENDSTKQFPAQIIIDEDLSFYIADIDMADFDNDGDMDYVVCFTGVTDGEIAWYQRLDNGDYQKWTIATNKDYIEADVADFNGDGLIDVAAVGLGNSDEKARVYLNQGNLFFTEIIVAEGVHDAIDAEDIDGDGDIDLAVTGIGSINTQTGEATGSRTLINDGNANFTTGNWLNDDYFSFASFQETIKIVDLNGDGVQDILSFSGTAFGGLKFFDGTNVGQFNDIEAFEISQEGGISDCGSHFVVFDIDQDGDLDIVRQEKCENELSVLYQTGNLEFERIKIDLNWWQGGNPTAKMSVGDLDNDGDLDLVFPEQGSSVDGDISWYENIEGQLYRHDIYAELKGVRIPKMGDIDNDGDLDIVATVSGDINEENEVILYENVDGENYISWRLHDNMDYAADIELADIDKDGDLDAFVTARDADDLVWLRNDGQKANWVADTIFPEANTPLGIVATDIDGDNDSDVILCSWNDDKVFGFRNTDANFSPFVVDSDIDGPREVEAADFDGDGDIDLAVVATETVNTLALYINNGSESFTRTILQTGKSARDIELGDWDGNGTTDILIAVFDNDDVDDVIVYYNDGYANFTAETLLGGVSRTNSLKLNDLDADGDLDLVMGFDGDYAIYVILNDEEGITIIPNTNFGDSTVPGIDIGDVDGDGIPEIVYADFDRDDLVLLSLKCLSLPALSVEATPATCGLDNGVASTSLNGENFTYLWSTEDTTPAINDLPAGTYSVTVTNDEGCEVSETVEIVELEPLVFSSSGIDATCDAENGQIEVQLLNDVTLNTIEWSNGSNTLIITDLPGGVYTAILTDENDCTYEIEEEVVAIAAIDIELDVTDTSCDEEDGQVSLQILNNISLDEVLWNTGAMTNTITGLPGGTYSVVVSDENDCVVEAEAEVVGRTSPIVDLGPDVSIEQGQEVVLSPAVNELVDSYLWSTGAPTSVIVVNTAGTYSVTVTDEEGCEGTDEIMVTVISSVSDLVEELGLSVFPNPTNGVFFLQLDGTVTSNLELRLINTLGEKVLDMSSVDLQLSMQEIDIRSFPSGVYLLQIFHRDRVGVLSVVRE